MSSAASFVTVAGIGDLTVDTIVLGVSTLPEWGTEVEVSHIERRLGGNLGNLAVGAAALGLALRCAGPVGEDAEGAFVSAELARLGLPLDWIWRVPQASTSQTVALVRHDGERLFVTFPGAVSALEALLASRDVPPGEVVFLTGWCQPPRVSAALLKRRIENWVAERRAVLIDLSWSDRSWQHRDELLAVCACVDWVLLNEDELQALSGGHGGPAGLQRLAAELRPLRGASDRPLPGLVLKRGSRGAAMLVEGRVVEQAPVSVVPVETVGIGDLFNAGFLYALYQRRDPPAAALHFATAFAGLALRTRRAALPGEPAILELIRHGR